MSDWVLEMFIVEDSFRLEHRKRFDEVLHPELGAGCRFIVTNDLTWSLDFQVLEEAQL